MTHEPPPYDFNDLPRQLQRAFRASPKKHRWELGLLLAVVKRAVTAGIDPIGELDSLTSRAEKRMPKRNAWEPKRGPRAWVDRDEDYFGAAARFRELTRLGKIARDSRHKSNDERSLLLTDALSAERKRELRSFGTIGEDDSRTQSPDERDLETITDVLNACPSTGGRTRGPGSEFDPEEYAWEATLKDFPWIARIGSPASLLRQVDRARRKLLKEPRSR